MRFFASGFFQESSSPKPEKITLGSFGIFLKICVDICKSRCTSTTPEVNLTPGIVDTGGNHQCQRYGWQIIGTISDCWHLKMNLKENIYMYVNSTTQRCSKKIIKTFLTEDLFPLPLVPISTPVGALWAANISKRPYGIHRGLGETVS